MRCPCLRCFRNASFAIVLTTISLYGQSTPEVREILSRLEKLESANRALVDEIKELRKELGSTRQAPAPLAHPEQIDVNAQRIDDLAQSKVEASQKLPVQLTGMALFNAYVNGHANGGFENPVVASVARADATGGGTLRQTVLGLQFQSPNTVLGAKVDGSLYMDFFGGTASSLNHLLRLRTATVSLNWERTSILVGQDKPIISPRDPNSYAQVAVSPLTGAGNLWLWQPQIRVEHRLKFGRDTGLRAQIGVFQTRQLEDGAYTGYVPYTPPVVVPPLVEHAQPGIQGRFELWHRWGDDRRIEIAPGFHHNSSYVYSVSVPSHLFSIDWLIKPARLVEFSGMFFNGQNVANLGALPQGFTIQRRAVVPVHSTGGWAQVRVPVTQRLAFDFYGGQQDDQQSDLLYGNIGKNQAYFGNVMYRIAPNVIVSLEAGQVRTTYVGIGNRLNNHYDLSVAYLF
jgi:hypothetical protein